MNRAVNRRPWSQDEMVLWGAELALKPNRPNASEKNTITQTLNIIFPSISKHLKHSTRSHNVAGGA